MTDMRALLTLLLRGDYECERADEPYRARRADNTLLA